jgi:hypothetical protein
MNITQNTTATQGDGERTRHSGRAARRAVLALVAAVTMLLAAPIAANAADGLSNVDTNNTSIAGVPIDFGSTTQLNLPVNRTIFLWTNQASGGFLNTGRRHVAVDVSWTGSSYEYASQSGGTGSRNCGINSLTPNSVRLVLNYTGTGYKSCGFVFRLKAGVADNTVHTSTMSFNAAPSGSGGGGCNGPASGTASCNGWSSGSPFSGTSEWSGTVVQNINTADYRNAGNTTTLTSNDFGEIGTGTTANLGLLLRNTGNTLLTSANAISIVGPQASEYSQTNSCPATLSPGATCAITVTYAPLTPGSKDATLRVATGNAGNIDFGLTGTALTPTFIPTIQDTAGLVDVTSYTFPTAVPVGEPFSPTYVFTLRNTGNSALTGANIQAITGANAGDFTRTSNCPASLGPNATCAITVGFSPTSDGAKTAVLEVNSTNGGTATVNLSGTAIPQNAQTTIQNTAGDTALPSYTFPDTVALGSRTYTFTIRNTGNISLLNVGNQSLTGPDAAQYSRSTSCGASLAPGATCAVIVTFAPTVIGSGLSATLNISPTNGGSSSIPLSGSSITPAPSLAIQNTAGNATLTEQQISANLSSSGSYVFTIRNNGDSLINNVTAQTVTGPQAAEFSRATTCPATLLPNATCTVTITFTPTTSGPRTAALNIAPTNPLVAPAPRSVTLRGEGNGVQIINDVADNFTADHSTKRWLDTVSVGGGATIGDRVRIALQVDVGRNETIEDVLLARTTNDTAPADGSFSLLPGFNPTTMVQRKAGGRQALIVAEVPATASNFFGTAPGNYGFSAGFLDLCIGQTQKTNDRRAWFQVRTSSGAVSQKVFSRIRFSDAAFTCSGSPPIISDQQVTSVAGVPQPAGTMNAVAGKGESVTFSFVGVKGDGSFSGINWRIRNSQTGDMFTRTPSGWAACADPCVADGNFSVANGSRVDYADTASGLTRTLTVPSFPSRGRWVVEASTRGTAQDFNYPQQIGSVLVNDRGSSPTITLSGTPGPRPNTNQNFTISASVADPLDPSSVFDTQGGRAQTIEWDLNNDQTDGPAGDGFETRFDGTAGGGLAAAALTQDFTTAGETPGPFTIRVRVTDNGSVLSADRAARSAIASSTFTINSPPVANSDTFDFEADDPQPRQVPFLAVDADDDPYTVSVTPNPGNDGAISGSGNTKDYTWPVSYTGTDTFSYTATDDKLGTGPTGTLTVRIRPNTMIDVAAPNGSNPVPANGYLGATTLTDAEFSFSSPQTPVVGYECRLLNDGNIVEDWTACASGATGTYDYSGLEDGLHQFEVRAINADGQKDGTPAVRTWRVDNTVPVTNLRITPPSDTPGVQPRPTNDPTPSYAFDVTDRSPQEFATYECRILSGPEAGVWKPCASPSSPVGSGLVTFAGPGSDFGYPDPLEEGVYNIEVRATDDVGLTGPVLAESFRVDLSPPLTSIASGPDGLINFRDVTFEVTSTEASSTFTCRLEGETQGVVFATALCPGGSSPNFSGLADDKYTLTITAIDPATNLDPDPPVAEFEVDATEPTTSGGAVDFGNGVTPDRRTQSRRITVDFAGFDARQLQGFQCRLDSSADEDWTTCQPPETYGGLSDGPHSLDIRSRDEAQNVDSTPLRIEWVVDRTPPVTTIDVSPPAHTNVVDPVIEFSVDESSSSECRVDNGAWAACSSPVTVSSLAGGPLSDGPHTFDVRSTDIALNAEATPASVTWSQDTVLPEVEIVGAPALFVPQGDAEFGWTVKDGDPLAAAPELDSECQIDGGPWEPCDRTLTVSSPSNGAHEFRVRATDAAGNVSTEAVHSWEVLGSPPAAPTVDNSDPADGSITRLGSATFAFSSVSELEPSFGVFECSLNDSSWSTCESPFQVNGLNDGVHVFKVRAKDQAGNISQVTTRSWEVQSSAPVTTFDNAPSGLTRQNSATVTFSSNKPGTFECRLDGAAWQACASPLELTNLDEGPHSLRVRAVSSVAPVGVKDPTPPTRTWTVDTVAPETTIDTAPSGTTQERDAQLTFSSNDPEAGFQCKLDDGVFDSCASPLNLNSLPLGARTVLVRAVDAAGNTDSSPEERGWTIESPPPEVCPPGFQGTPPDCTEIPPVVGDPLTATLSSGELSLAALGAVPLPAGQLVLSGALDEDGNWGVPQAGVNFLPVEQTLDAPGIGQVTVKISISATGPGSGTLPNGGGAAAFSLPVQAKLEASVGGIPLIGPGADCFLRPIQFTLSGTYDATAGTATVSSPSVTFPQVSAGCGALGGTVNTLLELPRSDIGISLTFDLVKQARVPVLAKPVVKAPKQVRSGKPVTIRSRLTNTGTGAATNVRVCLKSPTKLVLGKAQRCRTVSSIAAGKSATVRFKVKTKSGKSGKRARFTVEASYSSAGETKFSRTGHVTLMK